MSSTAKKRATYADLQAVPDNEIAEILDGVLYTQPRPASRHAFAVSGLNVDLAGPFQRGRGGPGGWFILFEPELHLGEDVLVPDLAGWRHDRMPKVPDVWFLDPSAETLEVLRLDGEGYRLASTHAGAGTARAEPFDAVELALGQLWLSAE